MAEKFKTYKVTFNDDTNERVKASTATIQHGVLVLLDAKANMIKAYGNWKTAEIV